MPLKKGIVSGGGAGSRRSLLKGTTEEAEFDLQGADTGN